MQLCTQNESILKNVGQSGELNRRFQFPHHVEARHSTGGTLALGGIGRKESAILGLESKNAFKPACQSGFRVVPANNFPQLPHQRRLIAMSKYQHIKVPSEGEKSPSTPTCH
ncbi:MAG: hypothetical protein IPH54_11880 [Rhodoferax sp.]|nr:hypothetical protein [Rhodoferax sp.]